MPESTPPPQSPRMQPNESWTDYIARIQPLGPDPGETSQPYPHEPEDIARRRAAWEAHRQQLLDEQAAQNAGGTPVSGPVIDNQGHLNAGSTAPDDQNLFERAYDWFQARRNRNQVPLTAEERRLRDERSERRARSLAYGALIGTVALGLTFVAGVKAADGDIYIGSRWGGGGSVPAASPTPTPSPLDDCRQATGSYSMAITEAQAAQRYYDAQPPNSQSSKDAATVLDQKTNEVNRLISIISTIDGCLPALPNGKVDITASDQCGLETDIAATSVQDGFGNSYGLRVTVDTRDENGTVNPVEIPIDENGRGSVEHEFDAEGLRVVPYTIEDPFGQQVLRNTSVNLARCPE